MIQRVKAVSEEPVRLRPGTLYGALDRLLAEGQVAVDREEVDEEGRLQGEERDVCLSCRRIDNPGGLGAGCDLHVVRRLTAFKTTEGGLARCPRPPPG